MDEIYINPKMLSVIVPVYNAEKYLTHCLESIRKSNYPNIEVILVDDGSTDSSPSICDLFTYKDNRFKVLHVQNGGVSYARNIGIKHCTGEYITFVDADDSVEPEYFDDIIIRGSEDFVYSGYKNIEAGLIKEENILPTAIWNINDIKNNLYAFWIKVPITFVWCGCYKRQLIVSNNLTFDESSSLGEDVLFNIEYLKICTKIRISSSSGYLHNNIRQSLVHRYYANRIKKEEKECQAWESLSGHVEYRLRWYGWHVSLNHYEMWLNKNSNIPKKKIKLKIKACYKDTYFRDSIKYIRKNGSLDEKVESYMMRNHIHRIFKPLWEIVVKIFNK